MCTMSALIHLQRSVIELIFYPIKELSNTSNMTAKWEKVGIRELYNSIR